MTKEVPLRRFTTVVSYLTEPVTITNSGEPVGQFLPKAWLDSLPPGIPPIIKEASMDDIAKKAIEPDKTTVKGGQLRKGLGDLPGESIDREALPPEPKPTVQRDPYKDFRPAPKTDKKK